MLNNYEHKTQMLLLKNARYKMTENQHCTFNCALDFWSRQTE